MLRCLGENEQGLLLLPLLLILPPALDVFRRCSVALPIVQRLVDFVSG